MKYVGKMKNNSARVVVVYRTVPGEPTNALVVGTNGLPDSHHDSLMSLIGSESGQQANELADILATRRFPDGAVMLQWLHSKGLLKKVPTNMVIMTPSNHAHMPLNELNDMIASQRGVKVEDLAVTDGSEKPVKPSVKASDDIVLDDVEVVTIAAEKEKPVTASDLRSMADKLSKQAAEMRRKADEMAPPAKKSPKTTKATA
jgi:hypothetical protein